MSPSRIPRILTGSLLLAALALAPAAAWAFTATLTIPNLCAAPIDVTLFSLEANNTVVISGLNSNDSDSTFRNEGACAKM